MVIVAKSPFSTKFVVLILRLWRHDIQHNDIRQSATQHKQSDFEQTVL
jgi:hypothetical protein